MELNVAKELAALRRMSVGDLRQKYAEVFGWCVRDVTEKTGKGRWTEMSSQSVGTSCRILAASRRATNLPSSTATGFQRRALERRATMWDKFGLS